MNIESIVSKYVKKGIRIEDFEEVIKTWFLDSAPKDFEPFPSNKKLKGKVIVLNAPDDDLGRLTDKEFEYLEIEDSDTWEGISLNKKGRYLQIYDDTCGLWFRAFIIEVNP